MKVIQERKAETITHYFSRFRNRVNSQERLFDCDKHGNLLSHAREESRKRFEETVARDYEWRHIGVESYDIIERFDMIIECDCGLKLVLDGGFYGTDCERCGLIWSEFGQRLAPRSQWGEETGESLSDIFAPGDPLGW